MVIFMAGGLALARISGLERESLTGPEQWLRDQVGQVTGRLTSVMDGLSILHYRSILAEAELARAQVGRLSSENSRMQEYRLENVRLRQLLQLQEDLPQYELTAARVIGHHPDQWFNAVIIDRGSQDGLAVDMPVIANDGLVGRIAAVSAKTSEVLLLTDQEASVGALIQASRLPGVVRGTGGSRGLLQMLHLPFDAAVRPNQVIVTSGLSGNFPPGLRIGYVVEVLPEASGLMQRAMVQSFVDFNRLEEVMVIRGPGSEG